MNIDQNMLVSYATFKTCCTKRQKKTQKIYVMHFMEIVKNNSFKRMNI